MVLHIPLVTLGFFDDIGFFGQLLWWLVLLYMAYWLYNWTREKVGFSPILTMVVAGLLIYFLVIEHPFIGALGIFGWIVVTGGILYVLGMIPGFYWMLRKK
ncbi:hypothetical protein HY995_03710 [Candidatus Micrarchaeota archaeon]|nr:hypothetical protein [Candidatus Micrarchaeota archaeon]MBI5177166.1 hypothetical protein [Candidatus Micrarchaeota archaeon]